MTGGRDGLVRTVLMAAGIGLGVALLLVASCVPTARYHRDERIHHRIDTNLDDRVVTPSRRTVLVSDIDTVFRGREIRGRMLEPEGLRGAAASRSHPFSACWGDGRVAGAPEAVGRARD